MKAMQKLSRERLWSLEDYAARRSQFRAEIMAHKQLRRITIGPHATLYFEDFLTMKYQVQEMLRAERIFEAAGIEEEIGAYNPLIPDGANLKATFMIEYVDEQERRTALAELGGIEETVWLQVGDFERTYAIANEDLDRSTDGKAAAVHFLRFELAPEIGRAFKAGGPATIGIDHPALPGSVVLTAEQTSKLAADLD